MTAGADAAVVDVAQFDVDQETLEQLVTSGLVTRQDDQLKLVNFNSE